MFKHLDNTLLFQIFLFSERIPECTNMSNTLKATKHTEQMRKATKQNVS